MFSQAKQKQERKKNKRTKIKPKRKKKGKKKNEIKDRFDSARFLILYGVSQQIHKKINSIL